MNLSKCDRCHKTVDNLEAVEMWTQITIPITAIGRWNAMDLCPSCTDDLAEWIAAGPTAEIRKRRVSSGW